MFELVLEHILIDFQLQGLPAIKIWNINAASFLTAHFNFKLFSLPH